MEVKKPEAAIRAILRRITGMLMRGELNPGDKLSADAELASRLEVSLAALKDAVKVLTVLGVLETRKNLGTFVVSHVSDDMLNPLIFGLVIERGTSQDLFELRLMIEVAALELAIAKATDDELQGLADNLRKYEGRMVEGDTESLAQLDTLFHQHILEMSKNPLFITLGKTVSQLFALPLVKALSAWGPEQILNNHRALYKAICAKDAAEARKLATNNFLKTKEFF